MRVFPKHSQLLLTFQKTLFLCPGCVGGDGGRKEGRKQKEREEGDVTKEGRKEERKKDRRERKKERRWIEEGVRFEEGIRSSYSPLCCLHLDTTFSGS